MGFAAEDKAGRLSGLARAAAFQHRLRTGIDAAVGYLRIMTGEWKNAGYSADELQPLVRQTKHLMNILNSANGIEDDHSVTIDASAYLLSQQQLHQLKDETLTLSRMATGLEASGRAQSQPRLKDSARNLVKICAEMIRGLDQEIQSFAGQSPHSQTIDVTAQFINEAVSKISASRPETDQEQQSGAVLLVDDDRFTREVLSDQLRTHGYQVVTAQDGKQAMRALKALRFDLVLLDVIMPEMNGYQVLEAVKQDPELKDIPILILSAFNKTDSVTHCIELGADDYLTKPVVPKLLFTRIHASLEQKRLKDQAAAYLKQINEEQQRTNELLLNILPAPVVRQLADGTKLIADQFDSVTVLFCDISGFTEYASTASADVVVRQLNRIFAIFDTLAVEHGVEKIKTLGDGYLAVSGLPEPRADHAERAAGLALAMLQALDELNVQDGSHWKLRIGLNSGPVTAGVIGKFKFAYDVWGDTVNVASRMESTGLPDRIQISDTTRELLGRDWSMEPRGSIEVKGKGHMETWFLNGRSPS